MKRPKFLFGAFVHPTDKAFRSGVFEWSQYGTIQGIVTWCDSMSVHVVIAGRKRPRSFHVSFWKSAN